MSSIGEVSHRAWDVAKNARMSVLVSAGMLLANVVDPDALSMHADASIGERARMAIPSALPAPEITGNQPFDISIAIGATVVGLESVRRTSTAKEIVAMGFGAQVLSCALDAGVEQTGWLDKAEGIQEDVGFSAIGTAWFSKFLLDRSTSAKSKKESLLWKAGFVAFAGAVTVGAYLVEGSNGGKLDMVAHFGGLVVGALAHRLGKWRKTHKESRDSDRVMVLTKS
jgi:hypothetical protein